MECDNEQAQAGLLDGDFDCIVFVAENVRTGIEYEMLSQLVMLAMRCVRYRCSIDSTVNSGEQALRSR